MKDIELDDYIINFFNGSKNYIKTYNKLNSKQKLYLDNRFDDSESIKETISRLINRIEEKPVCPICGKPLPFYTLMTPYKKYCSKECANKGMYETMKTNNLKKYGVENVFQTKIAKDKIANNRKSGGKQVININDTLPELLTDNVIIEYFTTKYTKRSMGWKNIPIRIKKYLENRYPGEFRSYRETYSRIKNHVDTIPVCPICGKQLKYDYRVDGYGKYCSSTCTGINKHIAADENKRLKLTEKLKLFINNTEYTHINQLNDMLVLTYLDDVKKYKRITIKSVNPIIVSYILNRYNDSDSFQESIYRIRNNMEKRPVCKTCGGKISWKDNIRGFVDFCGPSCELADPEVWKKYKFSKKIYNADGTLRSSRWSSGAEDVFCNILKVVDPDIERQWKTNVYPYFCDVYIPSEDLYIELNYYWKHGGHAFNPNDQNDINKLHKWERLSSSEHPNYSAAIKTWTISDPLKLKTAKDNNLNYVVLYTEEEGFEWLRNRYAEKGISPLF